MDKKLASAIREEFNKSMIKYPLFNSAHEGYGVLLEELDELWDEVKKRKPDRKNMRDEAIQVAAMAMKFIVSMENGWKPIIKDVLPELDETEREAKCRACRYAVLTDEELAQLKTDPCNTCNNLSNWKPGEESQ